MSVRVKSQVNSFTKILSKISRKVLHCLTRVKELKALEYYLEYVCIIFLFGNIVIWFKDNKNAGDVTRNPQTPSLKNPVGR